MPTDFSQPMAPAPPEEPSYRLSCGNDVFINVSAYQKIEQERTASALKVTTAASTPLADFIPKLSDPIKTLCVNFHIFRDANGLGHQITSVAQLQQILDWVNQAYGTYLDLPSDPPSPASPLITDTRIRFQLHRVEFYDDNNLHSGSGSTLVSSLQQAAVARNASTLSQINVYCTNGTSGNASGFATRPSLNQSFDSWVVMLKGGIGVTTLAHELGHVLDLVHTYLGGGAPAVCDILDGDFLIDVFGNPSTCPHVASWSPDASASPSDRITNNLMGGNKEYRWVSALQAAIMQRALTGMSVKRYVRPSVIRSAQFPQACLRLDGSGLTQYADSGGGAVNCQYGPGLWERFRFEPQVDGSYAIASVQFFNVYLRVDGRGAVQFENSGSGSVNGQFGVGDWERFRLVPQGDGTMAIESMAFPGVYLRMDANSVTQYADSGSGTVNCQLGLGAWEKFYLESPC